MIYWKVFSDKVKRLEGEVEEAISHAEYLTAANSLKEAGLWLFCALSLIFCCFLF